MKQDTIDNPAKKTNQINPDEISMACKNCNHADTEHANTSSSNIYAKYKILCATV